MSELESTRIVLSNEPNTHIFIVSRVLETVRVGRGIRYKSHLLVLVVTEEEIDGRDQTTISAKYIKITEGAESLDLAAVIIPTKVVAKTIKVYENDQKVPWIQYSHVDLASLRMVFSDGKIENGKPFFYFFMVKISDHNPTRESYVSDIVTFAFYPNENGDAWIERSVAFEDVPIRKFAWSIDNDAILTPQGIVVNHRSGYVNIPFATMMNGRLTPMENGDAGFNGKREFYYDLFANFKPNMDVDNTQMMKRITNDADIHEGERSPLFYIDTQFLQNHDGTRGDFDCLRFVEFTKSDHQMVSKVRFLIKPYLPAGSEVFYAIRILEKHIRLVLYAVKNRVVTHILPYVIAHPGTKPEFIGTILLPRYAVNMDINSEEVVDSDLSREIQMVAYDAQDKNREFMQQANAIAMERARTFQNRLNGKIITCLPVKPLTHGKDLAFIVRRAEHSYNEPVVTFVKLDEILKISSPHANISTSITNADKIRLPPDRYLGLKFCQTGAQSYVLCGDEHNEQFGNAEGYTPTQNGVIVFVRNYGCANDIICK